MRFRLKSILCAKKHAPQLEACLKRKNSFSRDSDDFVCSLYQKDMREPPPCDCRTDFQISPLISGMTKILENAQKSADLQKISPPKGKSGPN